VSPESRPEGPIRLMVVDDHTLFRRGLVALLQTDPRFVVVAEAGDAAEAQRRLADDNRAAATRPEVLLLDNHLPGASGIAALPALLAVAAGLRVLILTMSEDEADLAAALRAGACGYLLKTADSEELSGAILRAQRGQSSISGPMTAKLASAFRSPPPPAVPATTQPALSPRPAGLSPRERQTLGLIARGQSNKRIARELGIAEATVKIHVQGILRKLGLESRVQAAAWWGSQDVVAHPKAGAPVVG
jgi:two-component system, NarL family, nitrate/nitrite response regulator NarL